MTNDIIIYTVSDSIGETSQKLLAAVSVQYPELNFQYAYRFPFVTDEKELLEILTDALNAKAIVVSTLVNRELAATAQAFKQRTGLAYLDIMNPFFEVIHDRTGKQPIEKPGIVHKLDTEYFHRIAAIEFAVKYDDGKHPKGFLEADLVLLGVSRTSKTPLSMYLANKGHKMANLPLIPEVPLPAILDEVPAKRLIGLVCKPEKLMRIRSNRLESLGLNSETSYSNLEKIEQELYYAQTIFQKYGTYTIDVTDKSIEETAYVIEEYLKEQQLKG